MSVGRTDMGWDMGMSVRGFASVVSVILDETLFLLLVVVDCGFAATRLIFQTFDFRIQKAG